MVRVAPPEYEANGIAPETAEALDQRVRRLEHAVAALQDTQLMEDRVVERVAHRVEERGGHGALPASVGLLASATKMLLPADAAAYDLPHTDAASVKSGWLLFDLWGELRTIARMFADYRFRLSWMGRVVPLAALVVYILSWLLLSDRFLGVGSAIDRCVDVLVVVVVYKAFSREARRYDELLTRIRYR